MADQYAIIDGVQYNIPYIGLTRRADILDSMGERTADGVLHREVIGTYYNYTVEFGFSRSTEEYAALWDKLSEPVPFHEISIPDNYGMRTFTGYIASVSDAIMRIKGETRYWKGLKADFIAREPSRRP